MFKKARTRNWPKTKQNQALDYEKCHNITITYLPSLAALWEASLTNGDLW